MEIVTRPDMPSGVLREEVFADAIECKAELARIVAKARRVYPEGTMAPGITFADQNSLQLHGNFEDVRTRSRSYQCDGNRLQLSESFRTPSVRPPPPLPPPPNLPGWEEAVDVYVRCLEDRFIDLLNADRRADPETVMKAALSTCAAVRASSIAAAEVALASHPEYADPAKRRVVVNFHFQNMETLLLESASGGFAPDKWNDQPNRAGE